MTVENSHVLELIDRARSGNRNALGELLDDHRPYLKCLALRQLGARLEKRMDASDLVQQTCMLVMKTIETFNGKSEVEFIAWLRTIHEHNLQNAIRDHVLIQKRSVNREDPQGYEKLDIQPDRDADLSPSRRLMVSEDAVRLARSMEELPLDQREAVRLRYLEGWPLSRIAERLDRSLDSVAGLVKRGLINLRRQLKDNP